MQYGTAELGIFAYNSGYHFGKHAWKHASHQWIDM